jgi:long-subunit acyl-CoA synthetase (AMP-forming)
VSVAADGEIFVDGSLMLGYAGESVAVARPWPTGDLGRLDASGRLIIDGRKRNVFITAMGRNLSPEWIEAELVSEPAIDQAAVFGEGLPAPVAVLVCRAAVAAGAAVARVNQRLPGHARIDAWIVAEEPFIAGNGLATTNGRLLRDAVWHRYGPRFPSLTEERRLELL